MRIFGAGWAVALLLMGGNIGRAVEVSDSPAARISSLSTQDRVRIDSHALALSPETRFEQQVEFYGDVAGWMISRTSLPVQIEAKEAAAAHAALIKTAEVIETPVKANSVFERLVQALPKRMRPQEFQYSLTVLDDRTLRTATVGGGYVTIGQHYLDALFADQTGGEDRLAFVLSQELGHICRQHCRRGYQLVRLQNELDGELEKHIQRRNLQVMLQQSVRVSGKLVTFLYNREQTYKADLFALHLCRNVGFNIEHGLDVLRHQAIEADTFGAKTAEASVKNRPDKSESETSSEDEPQRAKAPLSIRRLQRMRQELDGPVIGDHFGLFEYDRKTGGFQKLAEKSLQKGEPAIVFVHGIDSHFDIYGKMIEHIAGLESMDDVHIICFHYPNDGSLARSGQFLHNEIANVSHSGESIDFICHSAGGLLFRYYAEVIHGDFRRAILQGTPHGGSELAQLRVLLETKQFLGDLRFGLPQTLENALRDGKGQISFDLQPDSLFLRYLNMQQQQSLRDRYYLFRGRAISSRTTLLLLKTGMASVRFRLNQRIAASGQSELLSESSRDFVDRLRLPEEFTAGDLAVTLESAALADVRFLETYPVHHIALLKKQPIIEEVVRILAESESNTKK